MPTYVSSLNRYVPIRTCLHAVPSSIEQHGSEWPEEWPKRLETYPDWLNNKDKLMADSKHWTSIVDNSYLTGMGIDWSSVRNVMDMKAIYGGYVKTTTKLSIFPVTDIMLFRIITELIVQ